MVTFARRLAAAILCGAVVATAAACAAPTTAGERKTYVIYSDNAFAPFEFLDQTTNTYTGLDLDLLTAIGADQGITFDVKNEGFDAAMGAVQSGQADGMIAGMTITDERKKTFDFSDGYFEDGQVLVVPADSAASSLDDLRGKVVAVKASTQGAQYAESVKNQYGFTTQVYEDSPTMYAAVQNGTNAACFEDRSVVGWAIKQGKVQLKTVGRTLQPGQYGFAVKKGNNPELVEKFNAGLAHLRQTGDYQKILDKYGLATQG